MAIEILNLVVYTALGIILMLVGNFLIDLVVPCHFPTEIKKGNTAVGWLTAGSYIAIGIILRAAIYSPAAEAVNETLLQGVTGSLIYSVIGIALLMISYLVIRVYNRKYNLNEEIGNGNAAAGIMVFGIFVGLAFVISGVIS